MTYSYLQNKTKNLLSIGSQEATNNQCNTTICIKKSWLFGFYKTIQTAIQSENFPEKIMINGFQLAPKISYLFSKKYQLGYFYELQSKTKLES
jgi:hypothetical protein